MSFFSKRRVGASNGLTWQRWLSATGALFLLSFAVGCGLEAGPQPPSLQLPKTISDVTATRSGDQVSLHWTTPKETTDKLKLRKPVRLRICRQAGPSTCVNVATIHAAPGKPGNYIDVLPPALAAGPLRAIHYEIFGINRHGRTAGASNAAPVLAGAAPDMVRSLSATEVERGVVLHWLPVAGLANGTSIQLQRTLLTPPATTKTKTSSGSLPALAPVREPLEQTLRVGLEPGNNDPGAALDTHVAFDRKYRYVASRVVVLQMEKQTLQLASVASAPVVIATRDTFPPAAPTGLAAVPVSAAINGGKPEVDLSWSANTELDVAQYLVYRREVGVEAPSHPSQEEETPRMGHSGNSAAQQIAPENPAQPLVAPAFRDRNVQPGHIYAYSVVAVDDAGNRSQPSAEVVATVPAS